MHNVKILVVDDEELIRSSIKKHLDKEGYEVLTAESGDEGLKTLKVQLPDIVLLDLHMPGISGMETLEAIKKFNKDTVVVIITAHGAIETAVTAIKLGAYDFVEKPFELNRVSIIIKKALENVDLKREVNFLRSEQHQKYNFDSIICESEIMSNMVALAKRISESDANTVLIQGESGTGKTLISRVIHYHSPRASKPFVEVTCTALPETLVESELFGYEKGSFTDAKASKKGLFEMADGGTVYLDEVGDMKPSTQAKFLKVIEEKTFMRIGGLKETAVDVRIIATTNRNLKEEVKRGNFREDLYYRLNVIPLEFPALRQRKEDIIPTAMHFINTMRRECRRNITGISKEAQELLLNYNWPGNIRELKNVVERVFILGTDGPMLPSHLPLEILNYGSGPVHKNEDSENRAQSGEFSFNLPGDGISIENIEKEFIIQALQVTRDNQTKAAKLLGLSRDALRYRMQKFKLIE
ncbi:MAG: sigma-54 dependent transcriptional regulator [Thermodesulfovibrionia bacterium]|nr:sigma-54 dependent transcriptional regulator [Thermodesulfovibrionia bacterium]